MTTIKDIAKMAGVSTATVSRILNGKGEASQETIDKVNKIIKKLNYRPNSMAKSLSKKDSNLIALLIPNLDNPFFCELVKSIEKAANKRGYQIFLCNSDDNRKKVEYYLKTMSDNFVAGAVINSLYVSAEDLHVLEKNGISTITIDRTQVDHPYSALIVNHREGGYIATKHLIQCCHKNGEYIFLSGPEHEKSSQDRFLGYMDAVSEFECLHKETLYGDFTIESGYLAAYAFLSKKNTINGIVCSNDAMAFGVLRACQDLKLSVPSQIKVIGYDNTTFCNYSTPRLSTVNQMSEAIAQTIIDELLSNKKNNGKKMNLSPTLFIRESTKEN